MAGATSAHDLAEQLALRLACTAHAQSLDPAFLSPFTAELLERAGPDMGTLLPTTGGQCQGCQGQRAGCGGRSCSVMV